MAKTIGYSSQVITGQIVEAPHVSQSIEAFSAANQEDYDISVSGSFKVSGSQFIKPNFLLTQTKPFVLSYDESTGQIFKMNTGSIIDVLDDGFAVYQTGSSNNNIIPANFGCNLASANFAVVAGGQCNTASGANVFIGSGTCNTASSGCSFIGGGECNFIDTSAQGQDVIGGGFQNCLVREAGGAIGQNVIAGGTTNMIRDFCQSFIGGGTNNRMDGDVDRNFGRNIIVGGSQNCICNHSNFSSIVGGQLNFLSGSYGFIGGGQSNISRETGSAVVAGAHNTSSACHSFVGAGTFNFVSSSRAGVVAGCLNRIFSSSDANAFIGGGHCNLIAGFCSTGSTNSTIVGGACNKITAATASRDGNDFIGGGQSNIIDKSTTNSVIVGGCGNNIIGCVSVASNVGGGPAGGGTADNFIGAGTGNFIRDEKGEARGNTIISGTQNCITSKIHTSGFVYEASGRNLIGTGDRNKIINRIRHQDNAIIAGLTNCICFNRASAILTGYQNRISGSYSSAGSLMMNTIIGGQCNVIRNGCHTGIFNGAFNRISGSLNSAVISGYGNNINNCVGGGITTAKSAILTGTGNIVKKSINSAVIGGSSNIISGSQESVIGGGYGNSIKSNKCSAILGGCGNVMCTGTGFANVIASGHFNKICANVCYGAVINGTSNCVAHNSSAIIAATGKTTTAIDTLFTCNICAFGALTKASGTFKIDHPNPELSKTHDLYHSFVESPTAGDNIYRFSITTENNEAEIILPEYYRYLNKNTQLWVSADGHFGKAFGIVNLSATKIKITSNEDGKYNVMVVGTRKDTAALAAWKGAERLKK